MTTLTLDTIPRRAPLGLRSAAALGVAWNLYGLMQYARTFTQTTETLMAAGMTRSQADLYLALPAWVSAVFAVGVLGGLFGSLALFWQRRVAQSLFAASLIGYVLIFAADTAYGIFAAIPVQLLILAVVVAVAAALLWASWLAGRRGLLR